MILEADSIELSFDDKKILYGVYLKAEKGKITGVLGRNGSGKTCLLRIIFGDLMPKYKSIRLNGKHFQKPIFNTNKIPYLPQHKLLPNSISLKKAFNLFSQNWIDFIAHFESFNGYKNSKCSELSSGELRVVETYLILNSEKEIIMLDEPFSFIAPLYVEKFKTLIQEKKHKSAIVVTDHFYREILEISDSIYFLKDGYSKLINSKEDLEDEGYLNIE